MSAIKFRKKKFSEVYDTNSRVREVKQLKFYYVHKLSHMIRHSSKSNKLRNVNNERGKTGNVPIQIMKV